MKNRRTAMHTTGALLSLALAACGTSSSSSTPAPQTPPPASAATAEAHNAADVTFATEMTSHHTQAVEMAGFAATRAGNAQVKALAAQISAEQGPEITQMTGWLTMWGQPVPAGGHDMSGHGMPAAPGMMSDADMAMLQTLSGSAFDKMWLQMMTEHHNGALAMASTELASGQYGPAKALATSITRTQTEQIAQMHALATKV